MTYPKNDSGKICASLKGREVRMEGSASWVHQQQTSISFGQLSSMVSELIAEFERLQVSDAEEYTFSTAGWVSSSNLTRVIRYGNHACLHKVLNQVPNAISAEYEVIHCGLKVFSCCEYLWPDLQSEETLPSSSDSMCLPATCVNELMRFHEEHGTSWLRRYQALMVEGLSRRERRAKIDKIGIVVQPNRLQLV